MLQMIVFAMLGIALILVIIIILLVVIGLIAGLIKMTQIEKGCYALSYAAWKIGMVIAVSAAFIQLYLPGLKK